MDLTLINKKHKYEKSQLTKKQNKEYINFIENKLNELKEPQLKEALFSFYKRCFDIECNSVKDILNINRVNKDNFELRLIQINDADENLYCFRTLYNAISEDNKNELKILFSSNFKKEDNVDIETELFVKNNLILLTMEKLNQQKVFQLLKQTTFFESERLQEFIFGGHKNQLDYYKQLMKKYNIDKF